MGMACTVLPLLLTAHLLPRRLSLQRWLPLSSVMVLSALLDAAPMLVGTAALMACTVLKQLLTAHLLPRRLSLQRWLPLSSVMVLSALLAAALMACTVLPLLLTAHMLSIISTGLLPKLRKISFIPYFNNLLKKHKM